VITTAVRAGTELIRANSNEIPLNNCQSWRYADVLALCSNKMLRRSYDKLITD